MKGKKTALIILDGWGHGDKTKSDAIHHANTPFVDSLYNDYPNCELKTFGEHVGLPKGQMGNSEVGHLNIGAGRIVHQDLAKINLACEDNSISEMGNLKASFIYAKENNKALHLHRYSKRGLLLINTPIQVITIFVSALILYLLE